VVGWPAILAYDIFWSSLGFVYVLCMDGGQYEMNLARMDERKTCVCACVVEPTSVFRSWEICSG